MILPMPSKSAIHFRTSSSGAAMASVTMTVVIRRTQHAGHSVPLGKLAAPMATTILTHPADGVPAALHDLGGDGPPVLFTHGNGLNAGMWATVVPRLRERFHCYGLDFRGHGASRPEDEEFPIDRELFVDEIFQAIDVIGGGPILAVGHSLGGMCLLKAILRTPTAFRSLWLFEPVFVPETFIRPEGPSLLVQLARKRRTVFASADEAYERFVAKPPFSDCEPAAVRAYVDLGTYPLADGTVRLSCSGETEARIFETSPVNRMADLGAVTAPIVVAYGAKVAKGNDLPPKVAPLIAEALPNARLERLDSLTHFGPMENGAVVAAAIAAHLNPDATAPSAQGRLR